MRNFHSVILAILGCAATAVGQSGFVYSQQRPMGLTSDGGKLTREVGTEPSVPDQCGLPGASSSVLNATLDTVSWGYFYRALTPAAVVSSGDEIDVQFLTHEGGNAYDLMVEGDPAVEQVYEWSQQGQAIGFRGPTGSGSGVHLLTGPIYVCDAAPGDVLQVDILDLQPRPNPGIGGRTFGSNTAGSWGYHNVAGFKDGDVREVVTIYEVIRNEEGMPAYAVPDHSFRWADASTDYYPVVTPCTEIDGDVPRAAPGGEAAWQNSMRNYSKGLTTVPCIGGNQTWPKYGYPGCDTSAAERDYSIRGKWRVPLNLHIGNMGLAPTLDIPSGSVPPSGAVGGNVDDRRIGAGASMYYPVQVAGGLLSFGDTHAAMGDSELDGTGIETSLNGRLRLTVHKAGPSMPQFLHNLSFPLLENENEYVTHGFTYDDYLTELGVPSVDVVKKNPTALDMAMVETYRNTRDFMMTAFNLTEDEAITAMTVGVDFAVAQVVNGIFGCHATIPKWMFNASVPSLPDGRYMPTVMRGTSVPMSELLNMTDAMAAAATA